MKGTDSNHLPEMSIQGNGAPAGRAKRKMPGIFIRGGRYQVDTHYRNHRIRASFLTREAAEANLMKAKSLIDEGKWFDKKTESQVTLGKFSKEYLQHCQKIGQRGVRQKASHIKRLLSYFGADTLLGRIGKKDIETYQAERLSRPGGKGEPVKGHIVNRELSTPRHLYSKAIEWNKASINPCRSIKKAKEPRSKSFFTAEEVQKLIEAAPCPMKEIIILAADAALRRSEILGLEWERIRLQEGYIESRTQKSKRSQISNFDCSLHSSIDTAVFVLQSKTTPFITETETTIMNSFLDSTAMSLI